MDNTLECECGNKEVKVTPIKGEYLKRFKNFDEIDYVAVRIYCGHCCNTGVAAIKR